MSSTITSENAGKEYRWKIDGTDGLRSYSYAASSIGMPDPNWNYAEIKNPNKADDEAYTFTDSSTGQPSARRGNLYNFTAATLGSSLGKAGGQQAPDSICPSGWQLQVIATNLATSVPANNMTNKSWARLLRTYGVTQLSGRDVASINRLREWPLQYLPTGYYSFYNGDIEARMAGGHWWSSIAYSITNGYTAGFSTGVYVQDNNFRGQGHALRS